MKRLLQRGAGLALGGLLAFASLPACGPVLEIGDLEVTPADLAALESISFVAERSYTWFVAGEARSWKERVWRAPDGRALVELLALDGKTPGQMSTQEDLEQFQKLEQMLREGLGRYVMELRDFVVRDRDLFEQNYEKHFVSGSAICAGRLCSQFEVWPKAGDRARYVVWVDRETLLPLKYLELRPSGAMAAMLETHSIDYAPDLSAVVFPAAPVSEPTPLESLAQAEALVGIELFEPGYLPAGFVEVELQLVQLAGKPVVQRVFGDGVLELHVAQYRELETPPAAPQGFPADSPIEVRTTRTALLRSCFFNLQGTQLNVHGKLGGSELTWFLESFAGVGAP